MPITDQNIGGQQGEEEFGGKAERSFTASCIS